MRQTIRGGGLSVVAHATILGGTYRQDAVVCALNHPHHRSQSRGLGTMEEQTGASMFGVNVCLVAQPRQDLKRKCRLVQFFVTILVTHML